VHERAGAALVLLDRELNGERLAALLNRLRDDPAAARAMAAASAKVGRPEAADRVAALVASAAGEEPM
jgi:UDP-N-acetylglucosamine--N-acetylmuramyl-(pentapeptide) pyrophosphoryl-undecaprenol N-acetylglucosamine transferase